MKQPETSHIADWRRFGGCGKKQVLWLAGASMVIALLLFPYKGRVPYRRIVPLRQSIHKNILNYQLHKLKSFYI